MALIINIDTSGPRGIVCLAKDGHIIGSDVNNNQKDHATFLHPAIASLLKHAGLQLNDIDAVNVCAGPGSYTGLRVGMATAKGLCYALNKPLLTCSALRMLAKTAVELLNKNDIAFVIPIIDARRMEAFYAMYDGQQNEKMHPAAIIFEDGVFEQQLAIGKVVFCGSAQQKLQTICRHKNAMFLEVTNTEIAMCAIGETDYTRGKFTSLEGGLPLYVKEFSDGVKS